MSRFFEEGKSIFIKPATTFKSLITDMKLVFYQFHEDTGYVGEARISEIMISEDPFEFLEKFNDAVFLTKKEVEEYLNEQEKGKGVRVRKGSTKKKKWMPFSLMTLHNTIQ